MGWEAWLHWLILGLLDPSLASVATPREEARNRSLPDSLGSFCSAVRVSELRLRAKFAFEQGKGVEISTWNWSVSASADKSLEGFSFSQSWGPNSGPDTLQASVLLLIFCEPLEVLSWDQHAGIVGTV